MAKQFDPMFVQHAFVKICYNAPVLRNAAESGNLDMTLQDVRHATLLSSAKGVNVQTTGAGKDGED